MTPVLLVPGTLCDERLWEPVIGRLGPHARALPPIAHATVGEAARAILSDAPERFVAAGFSLGSFVVLELLRCAPDRLAGAVLIAGNAGVLAAGQEDARRAEVALARAEGPAAVIAPLWPRYVAPARVGDAALRQRVFAMAEAVGADRFAAQAAIAITRPDGHATLRSTTVPVLNICGEEDAVCPPDRCVAMAGPAVTLHRLPGVGHFIPLEAPDVMADLLQAWLETLAP